MKRYPEERKQAVLAKMLPPHNQTATALAKTEGISVQTLYNWRKQARLKGVPVPGATPSSHNWSADAKLAAVIETSTLSEMELSAYCRKRGLYPEQIRQWKTEMLAGISSGAVQNKELTAERREGQREIKKLKKELRRKDKALAETAALLVLEKKLGALCQNESGDE